MRKQACAIAILLLASLTFAPAQTLSKAAILPGERPEVFLSLTETGRVSLLASSSSGVPIALYDKMEGRIAADGIAGKKDGRIDISLDPGEYKLVVEAPDSAAKAIGLQARPFRETNGSPEAFPRLLPGRVASRELFDLQTASYWIELTEDGVIEVEALGRDLAEAELWKGDYLLGNWKPIEERTVEGGRPMGWIVVSKEAKAGLYLLKLQAGPSRIWPKEDGRRPLHVRSGFLQVPIGGQFDHRISAFGRDFFRTEGGGQVVLSREGKEEGTISLSRYGPGASRLDRFDSRGLARNSPLLSTSLELRGGPGLLSLEGRPGDAFSLEVGLPPEDLSLEGEAYDRGLLFSIHVPRSSAPSLEPTGLLIAQSQGDLQPRILRDFCPPLSGKADLRRRYNLNRDAELLMYLKVEEAGSYRVAEKRGTGQASALYSLSRLDGRLRAVSRAEPQVADKALFELVEGYYLLRLRPMDIGVLDFLVYKASFAKRPADELAKDPPLLPSSRSFLLSSFETRGRIGFLSGSAGFSSASFYPLPLELSQGLSLELGPGENLTLPVVLNQAGRVSLRGGGASLALNGQALIEGGRLAPAKGSLNLSLKNSGAQATRALLAFSPEYEEIGAAAIRGWRENSAALPLGSAQWLDLGKREKTLYSFEVKESAVYVVESLGRLSTSLVLRSGARQRLFSAQENGYGRNASLKTWLRPGRYYLELGATRQAAGRCGIRLDRVPLQAELPLESGVVDRRVLAADAAARYGFSLEAEADAEIRSVGLSGLYPLRLEDERGYLLWAGQGTARLRLRAGRYAFYSLPLSIETRRLSWFRVLDAPAAPPPIAGTTALPYGRQVEAVWKGGEGWDRYSFETPSAIKLSLGLHEGLEARLVGNGGERELEPAQRGSFLLERGVWELRVRPREQAAKLPYSLLLRSLDLAPGLLFPVSVGRAPVALSLSVPADGDYEIWSLGRSDLRASLSREDSGEILASADDAGPDWNFSLQRWLKAGRYRLSIESLGGAESAVEVRMVSRIAKSLPPARLPRSGKIALDESGIILPFDTGAEEGVFLVSALAEAPVSLQLYKGDELLASGEGSLALPLRKAGSYRLRAWAPLGLEADIKIARLPEKRAALSPLAPLELGKGELLKLGNAEGLSASSSSEGLLYSPGLERPFAEAGLAPFSLLEEGGWVWAAEGEARLQALSLKPGEGAAFALSDSIHGFRASSVDQALLLRADTRGQFRLGISALPAAANGPPPYDWAASASWSQGSLALLPPGDWKLRIWDGQGEKGLTRKSGVGLEALELENLPALAAGARQTLSLAPGAALSLDIPASTLQALLGEGLLLSVWKNGEAIATRSSLDGRSAETLNLPASRLLVANLGRKESSIRLALLPSRELSEEELSASRPFEAVELPPEGARLKLRAGPGEKLCVAGDPLSLEIAADDGRYLSLSRTAASGLYTSLPASSGEIKILSAGGFLRLWLAKEGRELEGLLDAKASGPGREIGDAALLSGKGDAYRLRLASAGYVDISCPGPGLLALSAPGRETKVELSGSREDMHLFAWLPAGDYGIWQRPAAGSAGGGIIRADRVASSPVSPESLDAAAFIAAREYQAWSFSVAAPGLVGVGLRAERDGLQGFLYDSRQGLLAKGPLMFAELEKGDYLLVVKGLDASPLEYRLVLEGTEGSRLGPPQETLDSYKEEEGGASSRPVPIHGRGPSWFGPRALPQSFVQEGSEDFGEDAYFEEDYGDEGSYDEEMPEGDYAEIDPSYEK